MDEIKNHGKKWIYWFLLGIAIIGVYKALDNFGDIVDALKKFLEILTPFLAGIFIAYIFYVPCKKFEKLYEKVKLKFIKKHSKVFGILTTYLIALIVITILVSVILPVVFNSVVDLINNLQGYYESAINKYNSLSDDSILKTEYVKDIVKNIEKLDLKKYFELDKMMEYSKGIKYSKWRF